MGIARADPRKPRAQASASEPCEQPQKGESGNKPWLPPAAQVLAAVGAVRAAALRCQVTEREESKWNDDDPDENDRSCTPKDERQCKRRGEGE